MLFLLPILLLGAACCPASDVPTGLQTQPLSLPRATAATAVPLSWFVTVDPAAELTDVMLEACDRGDTQALPRTAFVLEAGLGEVRLAGESVLVLEQGVVPEVATRGTMITALYEAALPHVDRAKMLHEMGCRPWSTATAPLPSDLGEPRVPPLLLVADASVPAPTLTQLLYTVAQAGVEHVALWVDAPAVPTTTPAASDATLLHLQLTGEGIRELVDPAVFTAEDTSSQPLIDLATFQQTAAKPDLLGPGHEEVQLYLSGGTVADLVAVQSSLAAGGRACVTWRSDLWHSPPEARSAAAAPAGTSLCTAGLIEIPVLPVRIPRMSSHGVALTYETLLTGHRCIQTTPVRMPDLTDIGAAFESLLE